MRGVRIGALSVVMAMAVAGCGPKAGTLDGAAQHLGVAALRSIEFSGTGRWFQFGQAPAPSLPWPPFDVSAYNAAIDFGAPAARVRMTRRQIVEPGRSRPAPVEQRPEQFVSGTFAWNMAAPAGDAAPGTAPVAQAAPAAVEERTAEIWSTPHGFVKAALANNATSTAAGAGSEVSFTAGGRRYVGTINAQNQVERVQTWIDNTVLGDTPIDTVYSDYREFGGVSFPGRIARTQGGHPVLELSVSAVTANPTVEASVPEAVRAFTPPPVNVAVETLAPGVLRVAGGSHHSIAIDQADHIVVVEAPLVEERSVAVIAAVKAAIPNKPIRYLVNSHVHFDHSGGLRTYVDEGATIVTHQANRPVPTSRRGRRPGPSTRIGWPSRARRPTSRPSPTRRRSPTASAWLRCTISPAAATTTRSRWSTCRPRRSWSRSTLMRRPHPTRRRRPRPIRSRSTCSTTSSG